MCVGEDGWLSYFESLLDKICVSFFFVMELPKNQIIVVVSLVFKLWAAEDGTGQMERCSWRRAGCQTGFSETEKVVSEGSEWEMCWDGDCGISDRPSLVTLRTPWEAFGSNSLYWFCAQCGNDYCVCAASAKHAKLFYQNLLVLIFSTITFGHHSPTLNPLLHLSWFY